MSRLKRMLVVLAGFMAGSSFAQEKPQLIALASLTTNPAHYLGQTVAAQAIVDESDPATGKLKLTEVRTAGATKKSEPALLAATWSKGDGIPFPKNGQEAIVIGQVQMQNKRPILQVSNIIVDKEAIRRFCDPMRSDPVQVIILGTTLSLAVIYLNELNSDINVRKTALQFRLAHFDYLNRILVDFVSWALFISGALALNFRSVRSQIVTV